MEDPNSITTRLLTFLNIDATKAVKRKQLFEQSEQSHKLNKRRAGLQDENAHDTTVGHGPSLESTAEAVDSTENVTSEESLDTIDHYEHHFGSTPVELTDATRKAAEEHAWKETREKRGRIGSTVQLTPEGTEGTPFKSCTTSISDKLSGPFITRQKKQTREETTLQNDLLSSLSTYQDLYHSSVSYEADSLLKDAISLHVVNHVSKKRRIILKTNEKLGSVAKSSIPPLSDSAIQDQGFTRPSVLFLLPFRSSALSWLTSLTTHTPSPAYQIENHARFLNEYGLPPGTVDKLATAEPGAYPPEHVAMFKGNIDEAFRVGVKITRKSVKLFSEFYGSDIILASPLGLKLSIEKEKHADFLSSIEIVVVDQMDALTMQNWDHVKSVFSHLNQLPKESHDTDFSRIKPWYLDGHAPSLRQSVLLSAYETPETRALFNHSLVNVAGKIRTEKRWAPVGVPEGVHQSFLQFESSSPKDEADKRFQYFTTQVLPTVLKSAVQSANTVIFIPSSFDFIRVRNHIRKNVSLTFTALSEESSNQDISRAREAFFTGTKAFLLVSERYHFYRRYKLRGIRNLIFYAPPDHQQFYTEFTSYPFLDDGVEGTDVTCRVIYSKWDWFRLERIVGTERATELLDR